MTAPTVLPAPEVVVDVDIEAEVPCFYPEHGTAIWSGTFSVCRHVITCCERCHEHAVQVLGRPPFMAIHKGCGVRDNTIAWRRL